MPNIKKYAQPNQHMKICIVSDSHDRSDPLEAAILVAQACGAQAVIHCGDLIGVNTLRASLKLGIPIHAVHGNSVGYVPALYRMMEKTDGLFTYHGQEAMLELGGHCWLVNPGSVAGIDAPGVDAVPTWVLGDLAQMTFEIRT